MVFMVNVLTTHLTIKKICTWRLNQWLKWTVWWLISLHVMMELDKVNIYIHFFFSLYINDLDMFLREKGIVGLQSVSIKVNWGRINYLKLFILLYADDTVIMAVSARDLQHALNEFSVYCRKWKVEKTKYMYLICWKGPMSKIVFIIMEEL